MSNVKSSEIEHFNQQASFWWDENGPFKTLHHINPVRTDYVNQFVDLNKKTLLDVGCGGGVFSEAMAANKAIVTAIDLAEESLEVAKLHLYESGHKIDYIKQSVEDFAEKHENSFDVIVCMEMLEHVPDPSSVIAACAQLVKPGGTVFFSTLNRNPKSYLFAIIGAEYLLRLLPKGTHDYAKFIRPSEMEGWARRAGLKMRDLTGMSYNPLTQHYSLGKDLDVNYLAHCTRDGI